MAEYGKINCTTEEINLAIEHCDLLELLSLNDDASSEDISNAIGGASGMQELCKHAAWNNIGIRLNKNSTEYTTFLSTLTNTTQQILCISEIVSFSHTIGNYIVNTIITMTISDSTFSIRKETIGKPIDVTTLSTLESTASSEDISLAVGGKDKFLQLVKQISHNTSGIINLSDAYVQSVHIQSYENPSGYGIIIQSIVSGSTDAAPTPSYCHIRFTPTSQQFSIFSNLNKS